MVREAGRKDGGASARASLSVVVVDYRRPDLVASALDALADGERRPDEVVLVDVDPVDPPLVESGERPFGVDVLTLDDNPGFAAACNRGYARTRGEWVLFMNADVRVSRTSLAAVLAEITRADDIGAATCRLVRPDGSLDHACHRGIPSVVDSLAYATRLDRLPGGADRFGHYRLAGLDPEQTHDIEACCGAFMLVRREALEAVEGWDEGYFFYAEDLDLCLRLGQAGWRIRYVGTSSAEHVKGASSGLHDPDREVTDERRVAERRLRGAIVDSHERFYRTHLETTTPRVLRPLVSTMFRLQRWRHGTL